MEEEIGEGVDIDGDVPHEVDIEEIEVREMLNLRHNLDLLRVIWHDLLRLPPTALERVALGHGEDLTADIVNRPDGPRRIANDLFTVYDLLERVDALRLHSHDEVTLGILDDDLVAEVLGDL